MNDDRLDALLATPLPPVDDSGFSASVIARVSSPPHPLVILEIALLAISAALALMFLPVRALTEAMLHASAELANSTAAAMACLAIFVSVVLLRRFETD
jgi:hypothetical protein